MSDFNAFFSGFDAFTDSRFDARGRPTLSLHAFGADSFGGLVSPDVTEEINFPPGKIGNGMQFYANTTDLMFHPPQFRWGYGMGGTPAQGWGRKSFTIRQWWRYGSLSATEGGQLFSALGSPTFAVQHKLNDPPGPFYPTLRFQVFDGSTPLGTAEYPTPFFGMTLDVWHRTVAWYDREALEIGLQLDDLGPIVVPLSGPIPSGPSAGLSGRDAISAPVTLFDFSVDEFGLWHDYAWTAAERLADWNGGAGVGWPHIMGVISKPPMAYWRFEDGDITRIGVRIYDIASMI
jgi:hypothetical protein